MAEIPERVRWQLDKLPPRLIVEYLAARVGPDPATAMVEQALAGEQLPLDTRSLVELVCERLGAGGGRWRIELDVVDGRVGRLSRREFVGATGFERFDDHLAETSAETYGALSEQKPLD